MQKDTRLVCPEYAPPAIEVLGSVHELTQVSGIPSVGIELEGSVSVGIVSASP